jgi:threonine aldolase
MNSANQIDLRSDTVTRPCAAMRAAMMEAPLGDDVFRDDPTVLALEARAALLLGKDAALFVPTGTMANQIALRLHCRHGNELIAHERSHIYNYEGGAAAALAGVQVRPISSVDGGLSPGAVAAALRITDDPHVANTGLIAFEDTHNACGGKVLDPAQVAAAVAIANDAGVPAHLDGARLANAAVASGRSMSELAAPFTTVSICLSKGLGAPLGSLICGDEDAMGRALRIRKLYGGGMRQAGIVAAAGLYALEHNLKPLADDHRRADDLSQCLAAIPGVEVDRPDTNLVFFRLADEHPLQGANLSARLAEAGLLVAAMGNQFRAALHRDISDAQAQAAGAILAAVLG